MTVGWYQDQCKKSNLGMAYRSARMAASWRTSCCDEVSLLAARVAERPVPSGQTCRSSWKFNTSAFDPFASSQGGSTPVNCERQVYVCSHRHYTDNFPNTRASDHALHEANDAPIVVLARVATEASKTRVPIARPDQRMPPAPVSGPG